MVGPFRDIRSPEQRDVFAAFGTLFGVMAAHALLETARDALFLARLPAARLAWVYLAIAGAAILAFAVSQRAGGGRTGRTGLQGWLVGAALVNGGLWFLVAGGDPAALYGLYVWTGVLATVLVVRIWMLLGDLFTVTQAKRLFTFIGTGGVMGAIAGAGAASLLTRELLDPRDLVLISAALLALTALGPVFALPRGSGAALTGGGAPLGADSLLGPLDVLRTRPYLRRVAAVVLLSSVSLTLVDFVFKSAAAGHVPPGDLGTFFATTYFLLNLLSFLVQLFLVNVLLARFGVNRVLGVLPALLVPAAAWVAAGGGLGAALLLKGFDGSFRHSLHRTALEVLYVPLSPEVRGRVKGLIDVLGQRGGQALASVLILAVVALPGPERILAVVIALLALLWILVARTIRTYYLDLFRESLSDLALETRIDFPELDLSSLESLIEALNSPHDREVLAALDLLREEKRVNLIPALILYHPSSTVVIRALEILPRAGRRDFLPITARLLEHEDPEVRAATLRALAWVAPDPDVYRRFLEDPEPRVAATALIGACSYGVFDREEGEDRMMRLAGEGTREERIAMARAIQYSPGQAYDGILLLLAESPETDVQRAVVQAMQEIRSPLFVPKLLEFLPERVFRGEVRDTLVSIGDEARDQIGEALANPWMSLRIRRQLPRALAQFDSAAAADILQRRLNPEPDGAMRYRILRALLLLREREPDLPLDGQILDRAIERTLNAYFQNLAWQIELVAGARSRPERATETQGMLLELLDHKAEQTVERLFQLVSLRYPGENARRLYRGIRSRNPNLKAGSLELVNHLLRSPLREAVLATVDDLPPEERLLRAGPYHEPRDLTYERVLLDLLRRPGVGLRTLVIYHIGELRLVGMRETLETLPSDLAGLVTTAVNRALAQLREAEHAR